VIARVRKTIRIDDTLVRKLEALVLTEGITFNSLIEAGLEVVVDVETARQRGVEQLSVEEFNVWYDGTAEVRWRALVSKARRIDAERRDRNQPSRG
jgi:hypothetical protein